jgi:hypothetical protein
MIFNNLWIHPKLQASLCPRKEKLAGNQKEQRYPGRNKKRPFRPQGNGKSQNESDESYPEDF